MREMLCGRPGQAPDAYEVTTSSMPRDWCESRYYTHRALGYIYIFLGNLFQRLSVVGGSVE